MPVSAQPAIHIRRIIQSGWGKAWQGWRLPDPRFASSLHPKRCRVFRVEEPLQNVVIGIVESSDNIPLFLQRLSLTSHAASAERPMIESLIDRATMSPKNDPCGDLILQTRSSQLGCTILHCMYSAPVGRKNCCCLSTPALQVDVRLKSCSYLGPAESVQVILGNLLGLA